MKLTESQLRAVRHRGSNLLVSASAGAGKTAVLAQRCVDLLAGPQQPCRIDRLLVVTFTRAAAAELRVRIGRDLRERAAGTSDPALRRHLQQQAVLIPAAEIGTIDGWCARIVREHFAEAGVDLRFTVLNEQDAHLLRRDVLDQVFTAIHRGGDRLTDAARAWLARAAAPDDGFLRRLVQKLSGFREHLVNPAPWFARELERAETGAANPARARADAAEVLAVALAAECAFQYDQLQPLLAAVDGSAAALLQTYATALADWRDRLAEPAALAAVAADIAAFVLPKPRRRRDAPPEPPLVTEVRDRWLAGRLQEPWAAEVVQDILDRAPATAELTRTLLGLEARYDERLTEAKREGAAYEFGDVLRMALDLLGTPTAGCERTPTDIARRLQQRYEHILVDEYQDTSPVQVEILRLVTREGAGRTNRFMVGDVKQSIYGFREAEPRLFSELADAYARPGAAGCVEYLADNFRSQAHLLAALNEVFKRLFDRALGGTAYGPGEQLRAGRAADIDNPTLAGPRVEVHVIEYDPRQANAPAEAHGHVGEVGMVSDAHPREAGANAVMTAAAAAAAAAEVELAEREAQLAADRIHALLGANTQAPVRGPDDRLALRPLGLSDIVILLRAAVHRAGQIARVLRANGIPCVTSGRESLLDALEVRDVCNVLELLVNRRQDLPLAAYLRGPLIGLSAAELLQIAQAAPRAADFFSAVEHFRHTRPVASLAAKLDAAAAQLDRWAVAAREEELPALLRRIFQDTGLTLLARALKGGEQRVALLRALQNFAAEFAGGLQAAVDDFVTYLEGLAEEEVDPGALAASGEDVVRIMTIHGAKGLEFPVVFLLGAGTRFNRQRQYESLQCDADLGLGLQFADYPARATLLSARRHVIARTVAQRELEEELRLLYVAATRAREQLFIVGHTLPGVWAACCAAHARPVVPPLLTRLCVRTRLEWVLLAAAGMESDAHAASTLGVARANAPLLSVATHAADRIRVPEHGESTVAAPAAEPGALTSAETAWIDRGVALISAELGSVHASLPAMMSVSALKELALRESGASRGDGAADRPEVLDRPVQPLPEPAFALSAGEPDGRDLGSACHKFLELADFARLARPIDVQLQLKELVAAGRLTQRESDLTPAADIAWFATTPEGKLLARATPTTVRREAPFVYALRLGESGERTIVRGVIDCLVETPDGLLVLDYKTDRIRDDADLASRLAGYQVQLQHYARAAGEIFARPVARGVLIFLRARRIVDVPLTAGRLCGSLALP